MTETDIVIVGAGPIGLELAVVLKAMGADYVQVDAGPIAHTISWYPRQARFFSSPQRIAIAGVPLVTPDQAKATREQYLAYLRGVVQQFDLHVRTYERVTAIERAGGRFMLRTTSTRTGGAGPARAISARRIVLAIGDMHRPRPLGVPGEDMPHVSHYFDEPHRYFRQRLLIVGGRNSAVEAALRCHHAGARVAISYRRQTFDAESIKYWLLPEIQSLIRHDEIAFYPGTVPVEITPDAVRLKPDRLVDCDFVLLLTGYEQDTGLLEMAGVELVGENLAPRVDPETMETNVAGVHIAGTAAAGTQVNFRLFIENCHPHVMKIARALTGREPAAGLINQAAAQFGLPES